MAVPKCKVSKARRDKRRSSHWKLSIPGVVACKNCGTYNGREVLPAAEAK